MSDLQHRVRRTPQDPDGLIVLLHGRGADENDLYPLFDMLDPDRRFLGVTPRGPLSLPPGGAHWYQLGGLGYPDPDTFWPTFESLSGWLDAFVAEQGLTYDEVVLGGFSQGAVMSYALALEPNRPVPAALLAFSGFIPTVPDLKLDLERARDFPVAIGHGSLDPIIGVEWGRDARRRLEEAGVDPLYREAPIPHTIDPSFIAETAALVAAAIPPMGGA